MKLTTLDHQWTHLMTLCESEKRLRGEGTHPRLLRLVTSEIEQLATDMGFSPHVIATRDFRAEREAGRIVRILKH